MTWISFRLQRASVSLLQIASNDERERKRTQKREEEERRRGVIESSPDGRDENEASNDEVQNTEERSTSPHQE